MAARYIVKAIKFKCVDESGVDVFGSDEPYWIFTSKTGKETHTTRSKKFGDVDSGDTRKFNENAIIWPKKGTGAGAEGPIGLSVQLWESDQGDMDEVTRKTAAAIDKIKDLPVIGWVGKAAGMAKDLIDNAFADDLMGSHTFLYPMARLHSRLPNVGDRFTEKRRFGGKNGDLPFTISGGPDYDLTLEVVRVS